MRVAVVDIGTNSTRLLIADVAAAGALTQLHRESIVTRLGERVDATGRLGDEPMQRVFDTLSKARHERLAMQLRERAIGRHVGDQQPRGVGPDVDDRNPHSGEIIDRGALEAVS